MRLATLSLNSSSVISVHKMVQRMFSSLGTRFTLRKVSRPMLDAIIVWGHSNVVSLTVLWSSTPRQRQDIMRKVFT